MSIPLHLRPASVTAGKLPVGDAWPPMLCGAPAGKDLHWTSVETAFETTPFAFVMPYAWEGVSLCVGCVRAVKAAYSRGKP